MGPANVKDLLADVLENFQAFWESRPHIGPSMGPANVRDLLADVLENFQAF